MRLIRAGFPADEARRIWVNLELVKKLYALAGDHPDVTLQWIKAHDGSRWNEYADALASAYMLE